MEEITEFCSETRLLREGLIRTMMIKGDFIKQQLAIKEKEQMYVPLEKMLVFGAQLVRGIDVVVPKHDKTVRKYSKLYFSKKTLSKPLSITNNQIF